MSEFLMRRAVRALSVVLLAMGVLVFVRTLRVVHDTADRVRHKHADLAALRSMEARLAPCLAAFARFREPDALGDAGVGLDRLAAESIPGVVSSDSRVSMRALVPGWEAQRRELTFQGVPFERVMALATAAQEQRPPWRLVECSLRSGVGTPGVGQAIVTFERCAPVAP